VFRAGLEGRKTPAAGVAEKIQDGAELLALRLSREERPIVALIEEKSRLLPAEKVARAIERRRREIILTGHGKALIFIIRHFRGSMLWLLRKFSGVTRSMYGKNH
jgi:hypothetical protein